MQTIQPDQAGDLGFLEHYKSNSEIFSLPSGEQISIPKYFLRFKQWVGDSIPNTYNNKAVIDWNGEPVFAELAVLRLFQSNGWNGVWVDSYRRKYRVGLPDVVEPVDLPSKQADLVSDLRRQTGRFGGCWDVLVWKGSKTVFLELKRQKKDAIQNSQIEWLAAALNIGLEPENFGLVEWVIE